MDLLMNTFVTVPRDIKIVLDFFAHLSYYYFMFEKLSFKCDEGAR